MRKDPPAPAVCPVCGEDVPRNARACPHCGADHRSGWNEDETAADGLDLPDDTFDYDEFMEREFGVKRPKSRMRMVVAIILVLAIIIAVLSRLW